MWPYWLLFGLIAWMAVTHMRPQIVGVARLSVGLAWPIFFVLLALLIGLRHEVGGDWPHYLDHVKEMQGVLIHDVWLYPDPAYALLNWFGANVAGSVYLVNTVSACIFCWGLIAFCRVQPRPWLALLVAVPYLIIVVAMGYTRQGVAIGLAMLGIVSLTYGSVMRFFLWIALAAMCHKSAVILVPLALFANSKYRFLTILGAIVTAFLLFALLLQEYADGLVRNYIEAEYESSGAAIRIAMNALPATLLLLFRKRLAPISETRSFWVWMAWAAIFFIPILVVSPASAAIDRVALYWIPLQLFVWSRLPDAFGTNGREKSTWIYFIIFYSAMILFVWLNFAAHAFAWLPYQFYPWVALWS